MAEIGRLRVHVTVTPAMKIALQVLAERETSSVAAIASRKLREALDRTIQTAEVQKALDRHRAHLSPTGRELDHWTERAVEGDYQEAKAREAARHRP
jgi:hypothetical protein